MDIMDPTRPISKRTRKYKTNCATCMFMKKNPLFRTRIYQSRKFDPNSHESVMDVIEHYPGSPSQASVYNHLRQGHLGVDMIRHQQQFEQRRQEELKQKAEIIVAGQMATESAPAMVTEVMQALDDKASYIKALDNYISLGEDMIKRGKLAMTPTSFIAAINARANITKSNKDRSAGIIMTIAKLAAPKKQ